LHVKRAPSYNTPRSYWGKDGAKEDILRGACENRYSVFTTGAI